MSAMTTSDIRITPRDLGAIPRPVATVICELVNLHGVTYRIPRGGGHVFLYNGETGTRPFKISGSRPAESTLTFLNKWIAENVPEFGKEDRPVTKDEVAALAERVNTEPKPLKSVPPKTAGNDTNAMGDIAPEPEWKPFKYGFVTDGEIFKCTYKDCTYTQESSRGLHLHEYRHTQPEKIVEQSANAGRAAGLAAQQRLVMRQEAVRVLAEAHGLKIVGADEAKMVNQFEKMASENEKLQAKVAEQAKEIDDLKARISLIKEAMKA